MKKDELIKCLEKSLAIQKRLVAVDKFEGIDASGPHVAVVLQRLGCDLETIINVLKS